MTIGFTPEDSGRRGTWMGTYSGCRFWPLDPRPEEIHLVDVAHHLAMKCRYGGAVRQFYSVAEHSVIVSQYVPARFAREALLHDAAEAYIGDMIRPLKHQPEMAAFREIEDRIYPAVMAAFDITSTPESRAAIEEIDDRIVVDETDALMHDPKKYRGRYPDLKPLGCVIAALEWQQARSIFAHQFRDVFGGAR